MSTPSKAPSALRPSAALLCAVLVFAGACGGDDSGGGGAAGLPSAPQGLDADVADFVEQFSSRARQNPERAKPRGNLGLVYEANRHWPEAFESLSRARELDPADPVWHLHTAIVERELGRVEDALASARAGVERHSDSASLQCFLGDLALETSEVDEARGAYERARALAPDAPEPLVGLGEIALAEGDAEAASVLLERALEIDDLYRSAHYLLGGAYRSLGRTEDAERELQLGAEGLKRCIPDSGSQRLPRFAAGAQEMIAESQRRIEAGRWADAVQLLMPLVSRYPESARLRMNLGIAWFQLGRQEEGVRALRQAVRLEPQFPMIPFNLAGFHLTLGDTEEAMNEIGRSLTLDPTFAPAHVVAGHVLIALDMLDEAGQAVAEARRLAPTLPSLAALEDELAAARAKQ